MFPRFFTFASKICFCPSAPLNLHVQFNDLIQQLYPTFKNSEIFQLVFTTAGGLGVGVAPECRYDGSQDIVQLAYSRRFSFKVLDQLILVPHLYPRTLHLYVVVLCTVVSLRR